MELQLDLTRCNRCTLDELERAAGDADLLLEKEDWKGGTLVHIGGHCVCWVAKMSDECTCEKDSILPPHLAKDDTPTLKAFGTVIDHFEEHVGVLQAQIDHLKGRYAAHVRQDSHYKGGTQEHELKEH